MYNFLKKETKYCTGRTCDISVEKQKILILETLILIVIIGIVSIALYKTFNIEEKQKPVKIMKCAPGKCGI